MTSYDDWKLREPPYPEGQREPTDDHYDGDPDGAGEEAAMATIIHFVDVETYAEDRGRCSDCRKQLTMGDDWTIHASLATCGGAA